MSNEIHEIFAILLRLENSVGKLHEQLQILSSVEFFSPTERLGSNTLNAVLVQKMDAMLHILQCPMDDGYMSTREVCAYVGISERTLNRKVKDGMVEAKMTVGVEKYYTKQDVVFFYRHYHRKMPKTMP